MIVDEASLAGTFALDELVGAASDAGAKVLLVGDWAQLSAVDAGGAFSMLVRDRDLAPELTDVRRFASGWEKSASKGLRSGFESAIATYTKHGRVSGGTREDMLDALYAAWKTDVDAGKPSLMIAGDLATVTELNARAGADRVAAGHVFVDGLDVAGGGTAGVGYWVVTRENNRRLSTGKRWVKNGDQWTVTALGGDGSMTVKRANGGGEVVLPADYVRGHVELGYASTAHRAQGATADTAHTMVTATTSREALYVGATRGRQSNRLYVDTHYDPNAETSHGPVGATPVAEVLRNVLGNIGADVSAHTTIQVAKDDAESIATIAREYLTIAKEAQAERWLSLIEGSGLTPDQVAAVVGSETYGPLQAALRTAESRGLDVDTAFPMLVSARQLDDAEDLAAVLHGRVDRWTQAAPQSRRTRDRSVVGLIARPLHVTDVDMRRGLDDRAEAMQRRAVMLVKLAIESRERWLTDLGDMPADPASQAEWLRAACTVAAFHELHGRTTVSIQDARSTREAGDARVATLVIQRARQLADQDRQTPTEPSTTTTADPVSVEQQGVRL